MTLKQIIPSWVIWLSVSFGEYEEDGALGICLLRPAATAAATAAAVDEDVGEVEYSTACPALGELIWIRSSSKVYFLVCLYVYWLIK